MHTKLQRGGARNCGRRVSYELTRRQAELAINACKAAIQAGRFPNRFITIAWDQGGIDPSRSVPATGDFVAMASRWFKSQGHPTAWIWVQECGGTLGAHCHLLLHVPPELDPLFRGLPLKWVKSLLPGKYRSGVIQSKRILNAPRKGEENLAYQPELQGRLHYMLKCTPEKYEDELGLLGWSLVRWGKRQRVIGKRLGVWQGWKKAKLDLDRSAHAEQ